MYLSARAGSGPVTTEDHASNYCLLVLSAASNAASGSNRLDGEEEGEEEVSDLRLGNERSSKAF